MDDGKSVKRVARQTTHPDDTGGSPQRIHHTGMHCTGDPRWAAGAGWRRENNGPMDE
jgi:hypothetical protein